MIDPQLGELVTRAEATERWGITGRQLSTWVRDGQLLGIWRGGEYRYRVAAITELAGPELADSAG